jgi:hypothetical protein
MVVPYLSQRESSSKNGSDGYGGCLILIVVILFFKIMLYLVEGK